MKVESILADITHFKDEVFKNIRLLENRLTTDINDKYNQSNLLCESIVNRLNLISSNNDSVLELLASQKLNMHKIESLEKFLDKVENRILNDELTIKHIESELLTLNDKYQKIMNENLQVSGHIGPACQFKTISEYIRHNISELSFLKLEKDKLKAENDTLKRRLENFNKETLGAIDSRISKCNKYSDFKIYENKNYFEEKLLEINEKNMELRTLINKLELNSEKKIDDVKNDLQLFIDKQEDVDGKKEIEDKFSEINDKIENILEEIKKFKITRKDDRYKAGRKTFVSLNSHKYFKSNYNNNDTKNSILSNNSINEETSNINTNQKNLTKDKIKDNNNINKEKIKNENINENSKELEQRNITQESRSQRTIRENSENKEENTKVIEQEIKNGNNDKLIKKENNIFNKFVTRRKHKFKTCNSLTNISNHKNILKEISEKIKNNNDNKENNIDNKEINNINTNKEKTKIVINSNLNQENTKEQKNIIQRNPSRIPTKIKIESQEKKPNVSSSLVNISNQNQKKEIINPNPNKLNENNKINLVNIKKKEITLETPEKKINSNIINVLNKFPNTEMKNNINIINNINQINFNRNNLLSPNKSVEYMDKQEKKPKEIFKLSEEKKKEIDSIKIRFNEHKKKKKIGENSVDCTVVHLQLNNRNNNFNNKRQKNTFDRINMNFNDFGIKRTKLSPSLRRTYNNFYSNNNYGESYDDIKTGSHNKNTLKMTLKAAYLNYIKNKIYYKDK